MFITRFIATKAEIENKSLVNSYKKFEMTNSFNCRNRLEGLFKVSHVSSKSGDIFESFKEITTF